VTVTARLVASDARIHLRNCAANVTFATLSFSFKHKERPCCDGLHITDIAMTIRLMQACPTFSAKSRVCLPPAAKISQPTLASILYPFVRAIRQSHTFCFDPFVAITAAAVFQKRGEIIANTLCKKYFPLQHIDQSAVSLNDA
jgi:hypothetical protein